MSVSRYFGLPGCGKTTILTWLAYKAVRSGKYTYVYTNVQNLTVNGVTYVPFDLFGEYDFRDCLFLVDEAMVECGDRDYKAFGKQKIQAFVMHRHKNSDIVLFSQEPDGIDKKIRSITDRMYYVKKGFLLGKWISTIYRIPYGLVWPSENSNGENLGKIVMGYKKPPLLAALFAKRIYRPKYYKYFDSWEDYEAKPLPATYKPYQDPNYKKPILRLYLNKTAILLRSFRRYKRSLRKPDRRQLLACSLPKKHILPYRMSYRVRRSAPADAAPELAA